MPAADLLLLSQAAAQSQYHTPALVHPLSHPRSLPVVLVSVDVSARINECASAGKRQKVSEAGDAHQHSGHVRRTRTLSAR